MKSNASASSTSRTSVSETAPASIRRWPSRVFEHDAFDDVGDVLALVGRRLEQLVHCFELDELAHISLIAEQLRDRTAHDAVRFGFEVIDFLADLEDRRRVGHRGHETNCRLHA